jgi:hypothetical protein
MSGYRVVFFLHKRKNYNKKVRISKIPPNG